MLLLLLVQYCSLAIFAMTVILVLTVAVVVLIVNGIAVTVLFLFFLVVVVVVNILTHCSAAYTTSSNKINTYISVNARPIDLCINPSLRHAV